MNQGVNTFKNLSLGKSDKVPWGKYMHDYVLDRCSPEEPALPCYCMRDHGGAEGPEAVRVPVGVGTKRVGRCDCNVDHNRCSVVSLLCCLRVFGAQGDRGERAPPLAG